MFKKISVFYENHPHTRHIKIKFFNVSTPITLQKTITDETSFQN